MDGLPFLPGNTFKDPTVSSNCYSVLKNLVIKTPFYKLRNKIITLVKRLNLKMAIDKQNYLNLDQEVIV